MEEATSHERDWSSLPADLLVQILEHLKWSSHPGFALVCRQWRSACALSPFYPVWITPLLLNTVDVGTTNVRYYSPYYHKNFETAYTLKAPGAKICCATGGHLTFCIGHLILDADLLTGNIYKLPPTVNSYFDLVVYDGVHRMFGVETSFGMLDIVRSIRNSYGAWEDWNSGIFDPPVPCFPASADCNPVLHDGLLYLLGEDGGLAVYDENRHDEGFQILEKPRDFGFECEDSYLVESDQCELMAILIGHRGTPVNVVKLNERSMEWEKMENLNGRALFTGTFTTVIKKTNIKGMQNKVFLPRLYDWPDTVHVDLVQRGGELAFVPKSGWTDATVRGANCAASMWSYELGQREEASEFWGTEKVDYSIWVDFSSS